MLVAGVVALGAVVVAFKGGSSTTTASNDTTTTTSTWVVPAPTTTTVDPRAIQAGVAALLSHEGATPQELASVPSSPKAATGGHHAKSGGSHTHH
jgi:hypothetical protein